VPWRGVARETIRGGRGHPETEPAAELVGHKRRREVVQRTEHLRLRLAERPSSVVCSTEHKRPMKEWLTSSLECCVSSPLYPPPDAHTWPSSVNAREKYLSSRACELLRRCLSAGSHQPREASASCGWCAALMRPWSGFVGVHARVHARMVACIGRAQHGQTVKQRRT
jgi:hypothetical protein